MKKLIDIKTAAKCANPLTYPGDTIALALYADAKNDKFIATIDKAIGNVITNAKKLGDITGKKDSCLVLYTNGKIKAQRIIIVGLGDKQKFTDDQLRRASAIAANKAVTLKSKKCALFFANTLNKNFDLQRAGQLIAEGAFFGAYRYDEFISEKANSRENAVAFDICHTDPSAAKIIAKGQTRGKYIADAKNLARTLGNRPGNIINPVTLAAEAKIIAKKSPNLSCTILNKKQMQDLGMGGILAVGAGSQTEPRFIIVKYKAPQKNKNKKSLALVGKAITFDSGGISIKPSANMDQMKLDKSGGIAVLCAMQAIANLKPAIDVMGIIPSAENMPSGKSYRPGDIIKTYSGKTVEVQNTDAEGRMILSDALYYAAKNNCDTIVDVATLTGACMVALGKYNSGLMSNDQSLTKQIQKAAEISGEKVWPMPSGPEYLDEMKSKIADLKNIGSRWGGACTAAAFLGEFVMDKKWAHIDMAGMDLFEKSSNFGTEGSSGFGVRLLTQFVLQNADK
jgi:leucyl aminopeptidase